ncbi:tetratricopeptide repeat protein [Bacteroidota bacterium]
MRNYFCIILILCFFSSYSQEEPFKTELYTLEQKLTETDQPGLKIPIYKNIIEISFPDHLDVVLKNANELLQLSELLNNAESKAFATYYLAEYYFENDDFKKANEYYRNSSLIYEALNNTSQIIQISHKLGLANQYLNNYDESLSFYQKSVELAESIGNKEKAARNYQCIGTLYNDLQKYSVAHSYYEKALGIYKQTNNVEREAAIFQNIGVLHYNWGDFIQSIDFYKKSLRIYEELNDKQNIAISLSNIGLVYEESKNFDMALDYYLKALIIFEEIDFKPTLVYIFYNLGSLYRNIGNYSKSIEYFNKGLKLSKEISMNDYISYNYEGLSGVYDEMGRYHKALIYYKEFAIINDSLFNEEKHRQIEELEVQFQTAQHEKEIEFLKLDQELQESKLRKKETQNLILILSSSLTFIIAFMLFLFARAQKRLTGKLQNEIEERKKTEEQLNTIKQELEKRVKERTAEIEESNKKLIDEVEEHKGTMKNLEVAKNKAEEADRLKSNFLANISHEIRTPMNAITGFSQMLILKNISTKKRNEYINLVQDGCKNLTNLIDDIVDFATIESGQAKIEKREFNPHPILEYLSDHYTSELVKRDKEGVFLSYANENKEIDLIINTDPARLKQILSILIDNAIKFTEKGHVEFGFIHTKRNEIQFFVRDTGVGIDEKHFEMIFERFRQVDETTRKKHGGTGIGLSVAKNLVGLLDGEISLESTPGKGTTFFVNLSYKSDKKQAKTDQPDQYNWKNKVILVAEDKKINFEIIQETLSDTKVELLWAKNGVEALNFIKNKHKIDLVLMDIQMPVMDGYECAREIKKITKEIPIIAQTAYALPQDSYKCFDAGCDDYIAKPISLNQFLIKIDKYLS